jgi:hypothetical protein
MRAIDFPHKNYTRKLFYSKKFEKLRKCGFLSQKLKKIEKIEKNRKKSKKLKKFEKN